MNDDILLSVENTIATLHLNRPQAYNALSRDFVDNLQGQLDIVEASPSIRVVVIQSSCEKAFCAGADLKERLSMTEDHVLDFVSTLKTTFNRIEASSKPFIAALHGACFGGGLELALACDIRIAAEDVRLGLTEVSLAIIPGAGGCIRLPRLIGEARAKEMILLAKHLSARDAQNYGIVSEIFPTHKDLHNHAQTLAQKVSSHGPYALHAARKAIASAYDMAKKDALKYETECYKEVIHTDDRIEGLRAFSEKRKPSYDGK